MEKHPQISRQVANLGTEVVISIVTVQELFNGWVVRINGTQKVEDVVRLYGNLKNKTRKQLCAHYTRYLKMRIN